METTTCPMSRHADPSTDLYTGIRLIIKRTPQDGGSGKLPEPSRLPSADRQRVTLAASEAMSSPSGMGPDR